MQPYRPVRPGPAAWPRLQSCMPARKAFRPSAPRIHDSREKVPAPACVLTGGFPDHQVTSGSPGSRSTRLPPPAPDERSACQTTCPLWNFPPAPSGNAGRPRVVILRRAPPRQKPPAGPIRRAVHACPERSKGRSGDGMFLRATALRRRFPPAARMATRPCPARRPPLRQQGSGSRPPPSGQASALPSRPAAADASREPGRSPSPCRPVPPFRPQ